MSAEKAAESFWEECAAGSPDCHGGSARERLMWIRCHCGSADCTGELVLRASENGAEGSCSECGVAWRLVGGRLLPEASSAYRELVRATCESGP
jgi:hypothetical protein